MSHRRKNTRRKQAAIGAQNVPLLEFNVEQVQLIEKGMTLFAESLERSKAGSPNMTLARLSYVTVLNKLKRMLSGEKVTFDYNELVIISGCLDMIMIDASFTCCPSDFHIAVQLNEKIKNRLVMFAK